MRLLTMTLLATSVAFGALNRANAIASPAAPPAVPAPARGAMSSVKDQDVWHEVTIPAGTLLRVVLDTSVGSDTSRVEAPVNAHLTRGVSINGRPALGQGTLVSGVVTDATRSAKVKGRAHVAVRFNTIAPAGSNERYRIQTAAVGRTAPGTKKKDALEIGAPAAGGAIVGGILGGKKGALIGTAVGGGAGTAVVLSTRGQEVRLARGTPLSLRLTSPVTVKVRG